MIRFILEQPVTHLDRIAAFKAACARQGKTESLAYLELGYSRAHVWRVLLGKSHGGEIGRPCQEKLAAFIGISCLELFGETPFARPRRAAS